MNCKLVLQSVMLLQNQRTLRESFDLRALLETHRGLLCVQEHREETLIHDVDVAKANATKHQRTLRDICDLRARLEAQWGLLSVQEHGEETLIYDVDVVKSNARTKSKNFGQIW